MEYFVQRKYLTKDNMTNISLIELLSDYIDIKRTLKRKKKIIEITK